MEKMATDEIFGFPSRTEDYYVDAVITHRD